MHFCKIENFTYGEINERSFSNPHPWIIALFWYNLLMQINVIQSLQIKMK